MSADEMGGDRRQVRGDEEFSACPDGQADGDERLEPNRTADLSALLGGADQPQEVGNRLRAEDGGPCGPDIAVGVENRLVPLVEVRADPGSWLGRPAWRTRLWTGRTRDWRGG